MIEKCNPSHPDKLADRVCGAIVDLAYKKTKDPKIAVEALIGHGSCTIIAESSVCIEYEEVVNIVKRIAGSMTVNFNIVPQDVHLAENQSKEIRCGDNGIFKGVPLTYEQKKLSEIARKIYEKYPTDGKYILDFASNKLIVCQSCAKTEELKKLCEELAGNLVKNIIVNPLGEWVGGTDTDTGAVNRKLGSDMADSATGGGLIGKDLSKADVSVNIYAFLKAQELNETVKLCCAIGDNTIDGRPYSEIVEIARNYIDKVGGFEKFAEWGLF